MPSSSQPRLCGLPLYLLVDPFFGEPSFVALQASKEDPLSIVLERRQNAWQRELFVASSSEHPIAPAALPYLVALHGADDEWLEVALDEAAHDHAQSLETGFQKIRTGTLIESGLGGEVLMDRLRRMWTMLVSGQRRHLRLGSPRVMELVFHSAAPQALEAWLGPIERWHHLGRDGQWHMVRGQAGLDETRSEQALYGRHKAQQALAATPPPPLRCEGLLKTALLHSETITQTLDVWQRMHPVFKVDLIQDLLELLAHAPWATTGHQEQKIQMCLGHLEKTHRKEQS